MNFPGDSCPIVACATGLDRPCGVAVIRFSGFSSVDELRPLFGFSSLAPRHVCLMKAYDQKGSILDEGLGLYFPAPRSFTGENVFEFHAHGNPLAVETIIERAQGLGFRLAMPGEFSFRALQNKKLSLAQIEGLDAFIHAENPWALKQARSALGGELDSLYKKIHENFLRHKASLELMIDFHEDVGEEQGIRQIEQTLKELREEMENISRRVNAEVDLGRPTIVLVGAPNAGKSTLFNKILQTERAIVSSVAGTTRDFLTESVRLSGGIFRLVDTAGIRERFQSAIEKEGMQRSREQAQQAFFKIGVVNAYRPEIEFNPQEMDMIVYSHGDVVDGLGEDKENHGVDGKTFLLDLTKRLERSFFWQLESMVKKKMLGLQHHAPMVLPRHRRLWKGLLPKFFNYCDELHRQKDIALLSHELWNIEREFQEIFGLNATDDVLAEIFENFCIGK